MRNLLFITTDQERWHNEDPVPLPGHARLRRRATSYDRFYAATVACSPARAVMYTGRHMVDTKVVENTGQPAQASLRTDLDTLGDRLRDLGHVTAYKGKWHLSDEAFAPRATGPLCDALEPYGFADYNDVGDDLGFAYEGHRSDGRIAADAVDWMRTTGRAAADRGAPWCLTVNFVNPHDTMFGTADPAILERNRSGDTPFSARFEPFVGPPDDDVYRDDWSDLPTDPTWGHSLASANRPDAHRQHAIGMTTLLGAGATTAEELQQFRTYYYNCMRDMDRCLVTVLDGLERAGFADDTVVVYTSDHGEMAGAHGLFGKGPVFYDANVRLPLFIVDPDRPGGDRTDRLGSQVDLVPTMLALAVGGDDPTTAPASRPIDRPTELPGVDLTADDDQRAEALFLYGGVMFLDGTWSVERRAQMAAGDMVTGRDFTKRGLMRSIVTERHKLTRYFAPGDHGADRSYDELIDCNTLEVFDLSDDPHEMTNLAADPARRDDELIEELADRLRARFELEVGDDDGSWLPALDGAPWT